MATVLNQLDSRTVWATDGSTTLWNFAFSGGYLDRAHVKAFTFNTTTEVLTPIALTNSNFVGDYQLSITPAVANGLELTIYRDTPQDNPLVVFSDGVSLPATSLNTIAKQAVFLAAEAADGQATYSLDATAGALLAAVEAANAAAASAEAAELSAEAAELAVENALISFIQNGTGAIERTVTAKLREVEVSVTDYGAVADDTSALQITANTLAIQQAVDYAASVGAWLRFPGQGVYWIDDTIRVPSNSFWSGDGWGTVLKMKSTVLRNVSLVVTGGRDDARTMIFIKHMTFDYNRARWTNLNGPDVTTDASQQTCFAICNTSFMVARDCQFIDGYKHSLDILAPEYLESPSPTLPGDPITVIYDTQPSHNVWIDSCYVTGGGDDNVTTHHSYNIFFTKILSQDPSGVRTNDNTNCFEIDDGSRNVIMSDCIGIGGVCGVQIKGHNKAPAPYNVLVANCQFINNIIGIEARHSGFYGGADDTPGSGIDEDGGVFEYTGSSTTARNIGFCNVIVTAPRNTVATYSGPYADPGEPGEKPVDVTLTAQLAVQVRSYENVTFANLTVSDGSLDLAADFLPFDGLEQVPIRIWGGARQVVMKGTSVYGFRDNIGLGEWDTGTDTQTPMSANLVAGLLVTSSIAGSVMIDGLTMTNAPRVGVRATDGADGVFLDHYSIEGNHLATVDSYPVRFTGNNTKRIGEGRSVGYKNEVYSESAHSEIRRAASTAVNPQEFANWVIVEGERDLQMGSGFAWNLKVRNNGVLGDTTDKLIAQIRIVKEADSDSERNHDMFLATSIDNGATLTDMLKLNSKTGRVDMLSGMTVKRRQESTTPQTATATDQYVQFTGAGANVLNLPLATQGRLMFIRNDSSGALTVTPTVPETINGATTLVVAASTGITVIGNTASWSTV